MTDVPNPPEEGEPAVPESTASAGAAAWYTRPVFWIVAVVAVILIIVLIVVLADDDDDDDDADTNDFTTSVTDSTTTVPDSTTTAADATTTVPDTTTTAADTTTTVPDTTEPPETTVPPSVEPVVVERSGVVGDFQRYQPDDDLPFEDDEIEAHWYTWDETFVVVYAGWEATEDNPFCPGNSLQTATGFEYISNSPTHEGGCDPEESGPSLIPIDAALGARVCEGLVVYRTTIPLVDDLDAPTEGVLYGSVERAVNDGYIGATSMAPVDAETVLTELDPTADAYSIPEGWLPDTTEIVC